MTGKWLGKAAVLWALDEAPDVPPHLVAALIAIARYARDDGRGAHPSAMTVAAHIRKTERNAKKDIAELVQRGLLVPGDSRIVAHIRADRRPGVYDLAMSRGVAHDTPSSSHGVSHTTARGVAQRPDGVSHTTPEEILNRSGIGERARANGAAPSHARQPVTPLPALDCPGCGRPFPAKARADPDFRAMHANGEVLCSDCTELVRMCAADGCTKPVEGKQQTTRYCSARCKNRETKRRSRAALRAS